MRSASSPPPARSGNTAERVRRMPRFGSAAELRVSCAPSHRAEAEHRLDRASGILAEADRRLSRFDASSELSLLNADPRTRVPASPMMLRFAEAVGWAGRSSAGLVDATCLPAVEAAGYVSSLEPADLDRPFDVVRTDGSAAAQAAPPVDASGPARALAPPAELGRWREVHAGRGCVRRPVGVRLDSGGIGKGLAADLASELLRGAPSWLVDCGGDLRIGGTAGLARPVDVTDPLDPSRVVHRLHVTRGGVATSGVTRRSWDTGGVRGHHLIDPRTGQPADTGVLQVTALAPTALAAEILAKVAVLAGPDRAHRALAHGGVVICASGQVTVVPPPSIERHERPVQRTASMHLPGGVATRRLAGRAR